MTKDKGSSKAVFFVIYFRFFAFGFARSSEGAELFLVVNRKLLGAADRWDNIFSSYR